jgi:hypothetical protein
MSKNQGFVKLIERFFGERAEILNVEQKGNDYFVTVRVDPGEKGRVYERQQLYSELERK